MTDLVPAVRVDIPARPSPFLAGVLAAAPGLVVLAIVRPTPPDLMAQLARSAAAQATSGATWWTAWYGGLTTPSYSVITPRLMSWIGVWTAGIASVFVLAFATARLVRGMSHARLAVVAVSLGAVANIAGGRITFGLGSAVGVLALWQLKSRRILLSAALAAVATLASPLAGLFLALVALSVLPQARWRRSAIAVAVSVGAVVGITWLVFPLPGKMPMDKVDLLFGLVACAVLWFARVPRSGRLFIAITTLAVFGCFVFPTPVGANISRLPMLFGAPVVVAMSSRRRLVLPMAVALLGWAGVTSAADLFAGANPSTQKNYYAPLLQHLPSASSTGNRVEVVDPATHGPALYVANVLPLARGWERQVDVARNPLFYDGSVNAASYRRWLDELAVRWVALPKVPLDYASVSEGKLVQSGLPYLHLTWQNHDWQLYEVDNPMPLATAPLSVVAMTADTFTVRAPGPAGSQVQIAWTPGLSLDCLDDPTLHGVVSRSGPWIKLEVPTGGTYVLRHGA